MQAEGAGAGPQGPPQFDLPPYAINVFMPLVDVDGTNGPTEFIPRSHRHGYPKGPVKPARVDLKAGDALLFDFRVVHRGAGNTGDLPRPVLYTVLCRPWFRDTVNWPQVVRKYWENVLAPNDDCETEKRERDEADTGARARAASNVQHIRRAVARVGTCARQTARAAARERGLSAAARAWGALSATQGARRVNGSCLCAVHILFHMLCPLSRCRDGGPPPGLSSSPRICAPASRGVHARTSSARRALCLIIRARPTFFAPDRAAPAISGTPASPGAVRACVDLGRARALRACFARRPARVYRLGLELSACASPSPCPLCRFVPRAPPDAAPDAPKSGTTPSSLKLPLDGPLPPATPTPGMPGKPEYPRLDRAPIALGS